MGHKDEHHKKKQHKKEKHRHKDEVKKDHKADEKQLKEKKKPEDDGKKECQAPDYHKMHLCVLKHMGQMQLYDELSANPTHKCSRCGCSSNQRKNLCQPHEL
jgi:hypothetical protein